MIEVTLAMLVIAVAVLGSVSWTLSGISLEKANRETSDARDALRGVLEELHTVPFEEVFARFNADPGDDPGGAGTARGGRFTIETTRKSGFLDRNAPTGAGTVALRRMPLEVEFSFPTDAGGSLTEIAQDAAWGGRVWDLDGDGEITDAEVGTRYRLLPVRVRVRWAGAGGVRTLEHVRLLSHRTRPGGAK